jgi:hypothetical protein
VSGLAVGVAAFGGATSAEIVHALDMVAACLRIARSMRAEGHEHEAIAFEMNAKGYTFRARELRYDANGGHVPPGGWPSG